MAGNPQSAERRSNDSGQCSGFGSLDRTAEWPLARPGAIRLSSNQQGRPGERVAAGDVPIRRRSVFRRSGRPSRQGTGFRSCPLGSGQGIGGRGTCSSAVAWDRQRWSPMGPPRRGGRKCGTAASAADDLQILSDASLAQVARNTCQSDETPFSVCMPRSSNRRSEPSTRSCTVRDTRTSPGPANPAMRAPIWTPIPAMSSPRRSISPV